MASGGHMLQQQKINVQTQLKRLVNNDLKEICRSYGKQVSGNKADLQKRCIESEHTAHLSKLCLAQATGLQNGS